MDPNLRTLSLSNWMSLPGYDFSHWEATHPANSTPPLPPKTPIPENRILTGHDSIVHQSIGMTHAQTLLSVKESQQQQPQCRLCLDNNCTTGKDRAPRSHPHRPNRSRTTSLSEKMETNHTSLGSDLNNIKPDQDLSSNFRLPRRNLTIQRQVSKEVQTRALVSRVAEYYESYVQEMDLAKHFVNDTIVTSVQPIMCEGSKRHQQIRWVVRG